MERVEEPLEFALFTPNYYQGRKDFQNSCHSWHEAKLSVF